MVRLAGRQLSANLRCPHDDAFVRIADPSEVDSNYTADYVVCEEFGEEASLGQVREALNKGYAEHVHAPHMSDVQIYVDEEGQLKNLPFNPIASAIANQPLFGPAVILLGKARWK